MDLSRLTRLRQIAISNPCPEDWDSMEGDQQKRFCAGCGCFVHNVSSLDANEAEKLLDTTERVCTRLIVDKQKGVLTRDGWVPRLLLAGAIAATVAGCSNETAQPLTGSPATPVKNAPSPEISQPSAIMGDVAVTPEPTLGKVRTPISGKGSISNRDANHSGKNVGKH